MNTLSDREAAFLETKFGIGWLQVRRNRIMDHRPDPCFSELLLQLLTVATSNNKQMPNRLRPFRDRRQL